MKLIGKTKLILTDAEKQTLQAARTILNEIAIKMDKAIEVPWSMWDDDEIWGACEIIDSFIQEEEE